ncbi:hypothetical protein [Actinoplanes sp. N902-109]|uniref:hypothetical protein n=1 Tax=Actinoplanes sp. (strain N902-109) TaxID=649831 RepID=UPI0012FC643B|nr:hypothetical protein [Actinoplanes sp. N902-109]
MNGTSATGGRCEAISWDPAVIAARVGSEARPTSMTTISTYRRVVPVKPSAL